MTVEVVELPGRQFCTDCAGDVGTPCMQCGGSGLLPFSPGFCAQGTRGCGSALSRDGWHTIGTERLPRYRCLYGHLTAIRFMPIQEAA